VIEKGDESCKLESVEGERRSENGYILNSNDDIIQSEILSIGNMVGQ
jgi:hypothetical protein